MKTIGIMIAILAMFPASAFNNCITIRGMVVDAETGMPLNTCYVYLEGTDYVAQTDRYGVFLVRVPDSYCGSVMVVWEKGYDKFYMPVEKMNGEEIVINLRKTPIYDHENIMWPESIEYRDNRQEFGIMSSLKRKSRHD